MTDIQQEAGMCARCWGKAFTAAYGIGSKTQAGEYERIVASCACTPAQRYGVADSFAAGYTARDKEIAELRAQAAQPVKKLTETREIISLLLWKCDNGQGDISVEHYRNAFKTAIAELDSVEGRQP